MKSGETNKYLPVLKVLENHWFIAAKQRSRIAMPLGISPDGFIETLDLTQAPHLLVSGSVMSGKTEFVKSLITALVLSYRPDELRLILDDSTRVEMLSFNGLPHLARPVITNVDDTIGVLRWIDNEIADRYRKFSAVNTSNIQVHNQKNKTGNVLPFLVIVIYELSDLMAKYPDVAESLISKISLSGPDAGIHLVVVTQRPAPDVITNAIKSHFHSRICFNVVESGDSKVVLDTGGAEKLPENNEMLYLAAGARSPKRLQGIRISDFEIDNLVSTSKTR
jgi:DNA segregation ATPase FtsK/SpoIIIE, S-DNA-T family